MLNEKIVEKKIDNNLVLVANIFYGHKIDYWFCHGTLLGIIRDKNLIEWDPDIDVAVWEESTSRKKLTKIMTTNNFKLETDSFFSGDNLLSFSKEGGRKVDVHFYKKMHHKINGQHMAVVYMSYLPKNIFFKILDALSVARTYRGKFKSFVKIFGIFQSFFLFVKTKLIKKNIFYKSAGYCEPMELLNEFKEIEFFNSKVIIPSKSEEYLEYIYGQDWKTPKKDFYYAEEKKNSTTTIT